MQSHRTQVVLVTGPSRSGKSAFAERLAVETNRPVTYIATARTNPDDREWQARIEQHRQTRPQTWTTLEIPLQLPQAIATAPAGATYLVDSLGSWAANWIECEPDLWDRQVEQLSDALQHCRADVILVAEEVGWGVVPAYELGRRFRDRLGLLCQRVGALSDAVYLVAAGYAIDLVQMGRSASGDPVGDKTEPQSF
ncbi:bifunctional adenosylcobinamide kinase/adenosylcobinamide-phosphate guanylyltransferase [Synechococcus sp. PCC 7336]|uniref:bifunctional adenosylcobinamide kinase/adenosylcobinamide-phosphate guanylyltransferase n=1 Tax=Synechococcus sp. PCC 7336 TaxID=195250 RepID=UPI000347F994|nr:bifunctional adenosylcobinamide kinase/adenosylcobinamide-phosphate guanylyltransferase [Synechococcus sp. PCC 7336]